MRGGEQVWLVALLGLAGIVLLVLSAERVVQRSLDLAHHFGLSELFIGLTILSIGTSIPEISSNIIGGIGILTGNLDRIITSATVLGANVGSSIVQQTLIVGVVVFVTGHLKFKKKFLAENYVALLATFLIVFVLGYDGWLSRSDCMIMLLVFALYLYFLYRQEHEHRHVRYQKIKKGSLVNPYKTVAWLVVGFVGVFFGSSIALQSVQSLVTLTGVSGSLLGVLTLGVASALPELITVMAAVKKQSTGISIGTLIGSNIINPLLGIGIGGLIARYTVPHAFIQWDLPMQIITACLLLLWVNRHHRTVPKLGGVILVLVYIIYILIRINWFSGDL